MGFCSVLFGFDVLFGVGVVGLGFGVILGVVGIVIVVVMGWWLFNGVVLGFGMCCVVFCFKGYGLCVGLVGSGFLKGIGLFFCIVMFCFGVGVIVGIGVICFDFDVCFVCCVGIICVVVFRGVVICGVVCLGVVGCVCIGLVGFGVCEVVWFLVGVLLFGWG